jgi:hypothetical protein
VGVEAWGFAGRVGVLRVIAAASWYSVPGIPPGIHAYGYGGGGGAEVRGVSVI